MVDNQEFFSVPEESSKVKSRIVAKYFASWAQVLLPSVKQRNGKMGYIDLYSGPGSYSDGSKSTPLLILEYAIQKPDLAKHLMTLFNDKNKENCEKLKQSIATLDLTQLKYQPQVNCDEVGTNFISYFASIKMIPSVVFLDPWGYKGLSLDLINATIKDWGCEAIFFFNYIRVNAAIENPRFTEHIKKIFGLDRAARLQEKAPTLSVTDRENYVMDELISALKEEHGKFVLKFRFWDESRDRTSHYLIFVTKGFRGYEIMKDIMAKESSPSSGPVASFEYIPLSQQLLFPMMPIPTINDLKTELLHDFQGATQKMQEIYQQHSIGKPYIKKNYKQALMELEAKNDITTTPPQDERRKDTMGDNVVIQFRN